jgi:glutamyl-tRNA synthetase
LGLNALHTLHCLIIVSPLTINIVIVVDIVNIVERNKMMSSIRVRWAPSNTGPDIHVGNLRTIFYNYLFAKKVGATTVFRIEDSDLVRSKEEYANNISDTLNWLGLTADEGYNIGGDFGPYQQSKKFDRYKQVADELVEKGCAYRCYCTNDELNTLRASLPKTQQHTFKYPGICRDRKDWPAHKEYVIRLKAPTEGFVEWDDIVLGKITVPNKENFDWVLIRSNGSPLYNLGCCVDDKDQMISHIIRGRDHVSNSNIQVIIHNMLGSQEIKYCHLPMLLGQDKTKLSKRHASVSVSDYKNAGYSVNGILNYIVRFGWGYGNQELFTMDELIEKFSLEACGKNDGCFDPKKFAAIQYEHLKSPTLTTDTQYAQGLLPFLHNAGLTDLDHKQIETLIPLVRTRAHTFKDAANELDPILRKDINVNTDAVKSILTPDAKDKLLAYYKFLQTITDWRENQLREATALWLIKSNMVMKDIGQPTRVSVVGRTNSPDLFQVMGALGKTTTLTRISYQV